MKRTLWMAVLAAGVCQIGCNGKTNDTATASNTSTAPATATAPANAPPAIPAGNLVSSGDAPATALDQMVPIQSLNLANPTKPEEVVGAFLDGMRTGNARVIEGLLSTRARKEIEDKGLDIAPIGSPQAKFEIGVAQLAAPKDPSTVLVSSNWIEPGTNGQPVGEYEVVWCLIKEAAGWRICEMAVDTHQEGQEIQVVNFENLSDVVKPETSPANSAAPSEVPRTAAAPAGVPGAAPALPASAPALPGGNIAPGALPSSQPTGVPSSLPSLPSGQLPGTVPSASPGIPQGNGSNLPPLPAGPSGSSGSGSLPPLPPSGFGGRG